MSAIGLVSWLWRPVWRLREVGWGDIALAAILSVWAIGLVSGVVVSQAAQRRRRRDRGAGDDDPGGLGTPGIPSPPRPRWPSVPPLNELLIGPMVRCGPGLPAVFVIAFFAATRLDRRRLVVAAALCLAAVTLQSFYDPNLGASFLVAGRARCTGVLPGRAAGAIPRAGGGGAARAERGAAGAA